MALHVDDINVGDLVVVSDYKGQPGFGRRPREMTGQPLIVLAISLPFIVVGFDGHVDTVDVRVWELRRTTQEYYEAFTTGDVVESSGSRPRRKRRRVTCGAPDPMACSRCGDRLVERMVSAKEGWRWWCRQCHNDAGPASSAPQQ